MNTATYNWIVRRSETAAAIQEAVKAGTCTTPDQVVAIAAKHGDEVFWTGTMRGVAESLDATIAAILQEIGMPAHIRGYWYALEAVKLAAQDFSLIHAITKGVYPDVAEKFGTTASRVERDIRLAIEAAWDRGDVDTLHSYFGYTVSAAKGRPTNGEFIAMVAGHSVRRAAA